jgi:hypothetical protein
MYRTGADAITFSTTGFGTTVSLLDFFAGCELVVEESILRLELIIIVQKCTSNSTNQK